VAIKVLVSAGEASGDLYAASLVEALRRHFPDAVYFGCAGPRMQAAGVRIIVDAHSLAVVGLFEVVAHLPRIYGEFRKLIAAARSEQPDFALLTDSPDFNLRVARKLKSLGIPVIYLVAPQVWAWRKDRLPAIRDTVRRLLCLFPFEEPFFREHGVDAYYIGHPLTRLARPSLDRQAFLRKFGIPGDRPLIALLPGSRPGEIARHLAALSDAVQRIEAERPCSIVLGTPPGFSANLPAPFFWERFFRQSIQVVEGSTWDLLAHADLALAASGTVTVEAALLGTPMVTFYRVSGLSWWMGRFLVRVPFYSMVNLIAGRRVVPELIQDGMTGERLAGEALHLLDNPSARAEMKAGLSDVRRKLETDRDPMETAAELIVSVLDKELVHDR
jgi:lipid-A-disaccharide synthase